jgi:uncharacterized Zn-finger protein
MIKNYLYALIILATVPAYCAAPAEAMPESSSAAPAEAAQPFSKQDILNYFGQMSIAQPATNSFDSNDQKKIAHDIVYNNLSLAEYMEQQDNPHQSNALQHSGQSGADGSMPEDTQQESDALKYAPSYTIATHVAASHFAMSQTTAQHRINFEARQKLLLAQQAKLEQQAQAEQGQGAGAAAPAEPQAQTKQEAKRVKASTADKKKHQCPYEGCPSRFEYPKDLIRHIRMHTGEKPFKCSWRQCDKRFARKNHLNEHMRTHTGEKPFACSWRQCNKGFARKNHLNEHMRTHTGEKPFACSKCQEVFSRKGHRNQHTKTCTGELRKRRTPAQSSSSKRRKKNSSDDEYDDNDEENDDDSENEADE